MNAESAISWLLAEEMQGWRLERDNGEKASDCLDADNSEAAADKLRKTLVWQKPGSFKLKAWKGKNAQNSQSTFPFEIERAAVQQSSKSPQMDVQEILRQAEQNAYARLEAENWRKEVDKRLLALEEGIKDIVKSIKELHDDDDENDETAFDRLTNVAEAAPKLAAGFNGLKGFLKAV